MMLITSFVWKYVMIAFDFDVKQHMIIKIFLRQ